MTGENNKLLCPSCVSGFKIDGGPKGKMEKIGPYDTYVATPSNPSKDTALVFNCDAFGLDLQNNKIIPDRLAEALNVTVYVPDYFLGNPMPESFMDGQPTSVTEKSKQGFLSKIGTIGKMATAAPWFLSHMPPKTFPPMTEFLKNLKTEKGFSKLGGIGYCYGGKVVAHFNQEETFDVSVVCHPSMLNQKDIETLKKPILFCCAEQDDMFGERFREQSQKILEEKKDFISEFKVYENTVHGFAARPNLADELVKAGFEGAFNDSVSFFKRHLLNSSTPTPSAPTATPSAAAPTPASAPEVGA